MINPEIVKAYQTGGELPFFSGSYQEGGGWLRTLGRFAFPILKRIFNVASNTAEDVLVNEKPILKSLGKRAMEEVGHVLKGNGLPPNKGNTPINTLKRKRKTTLPPIFEELNSKKRKRKDTT